MTEPDLLSQVKSLLTKRGATDDDGADNIMAVRYMNAGPLPEGWPTIYPKGAMKLLGNYRMTFLSSDIDAAPGETVMVIDKTTPDSPSNEVSVVPLAKVF